MQLQQIQSIFSNRELAYLIWGLALICWLLFSDSRRSMLDLIKAFLCRQFLYAYVIAFTYIFGCIAVLHVIGIWEKAVLKDTIFWAIFVAFPLMYRSAQIKSFNHFKDEIVRPLVSVSVLFEFVFGLYTSSFWIEFLLVPLIVIIAGTTFFSEKKPEHAKFHALSKAILNLLVLFILISAIVHLYRHYLEYLNLMTALQFAIPLLLSIMLLPLLYAVAMYVHYENAFIILKRSFKQRHVYRYAMFRAMLKFRGDLDGLERWKTLVLRKHLQSKAEIDDAIVQVKTMQKAERNPHSVKADLGWSPYAVKDVFRSRGMQTGDYKDVVGKEEYLSVSASRKMSDNGPLCDTLSFMVLGEQWIATQLHLALNVNERKAGNTLSLLELMHCVEILYDLTIEEGIPKTIKESILKARDCSVNHGLVTVSVRKRAWNNVSNGYSLDVKFSHKHHRRT